MEVGGMVTIKEVGFGPNAFDEPTVYSPLESLGQIFYNIFVMRPGTLPSLPHIGIDIRQYLYKLEGTINYDELRNKVFNSCTELLNFINFGDIIIKEIDIKKVRTLVIIVNASIDDDSYALIMAMRQGTQNEVLFNFKAESLKIMNSQ